MNKYDDIINLPHYEMKYHSRMSIDKRTGQFSPFAALTGYDDDIKETARLTNNKIDLDEEKNIKINNELNKINLVIKNKPKVKITYFIKDEKKDGGKYINEIITVKNIDFVYSYIKTIDNIKINLDDIFEIEILNN